MQNRTRFFKMDRNSQLYTQFQNCAPLIGADTKDAPDPKLGAFRVYKSLQDTFVELFKIVLDRGFNVDIDSRAPEVVVKAGNPNPHLGDLFIVMEPRREVTEGFHDFSRLMAAHQSERLHSNVFNGDYVIQFKTREMEELLRTVLLPSTNLQYDDRVLRHINAVHHLSGRVENDHYKPAAALN